MNLLRRFMAGRYGVDQFSLFLLILSIIFSFISRIFQFPPLMIIGYIPLVLSILRILSKDIQKRSMENYKFSMVMSPLYSKLLHLKKRIKDFKTHKYFRCPACHGQLRVPRGKGKIRVTCPKCTAKFIKKT